VKKINARMEGEIMIHLSNARARMLSSAAAILAASSTGAYAQDTASAAEEGDVIVVTGQALANKRAIDAKREAIGIIDAVAADDIGNLPDFNAGDALRRVTGVNVLTYQGEPRFITIRGLNADYINSTVDGFQVASPDPSGRKLFTEVLPSSLAGRIEVQKTGAPDLDGHAVAGAINFVSRDLKSLGGSSVIVTARAGKYFQPGNVGGDTFSGQADIIAGTSFGADDQFELVVSGAYWKRGLWVPQIESGGQRYFFNTDGTRNSTPYAGNGIGVPQERRWYIYDNDRTRFGGSGQLKWDAGNGIVSTLNGYYYNQKELSDRYETTAQAQGSTRVVNQTPTSGRLTNVNQLAQLGQFEFERQMFGVNLTNVFEVSDNSRFNLALGWSGAKLSNPQRWDIFQRSGLAFDYDDSGAFPVWSAVDPTVNVASTYPLLRHREEREAMDANLYEVRLDYEYGDASDGFSAKAGFKFVQNDRDVTFTRTDFTGLTYRLDTVLSSLQRCPFGCTGNDYFYIDPASADSAFNAVRSSATATLDQAATFGGTYGIKEDVYGGYLLGRYVTDSVSLVGGLRYEKTDISSNGFRRINGATTPVTGGAEYGHWLPSLTFVYNASPDIKLRAAYARTIGRPRFADAATRGEVLSDTGTQATLTRSNPDLRPRQSDGFDISGEWYIDGGAGILNVGLFYKRIKGEIFTYGALEDVVINGVSRNVLVTQARNSPNPVKVKGIEIGLTKQIPFAPGFSVSANATLLDVDFPVTLGDLSVINAPGLPEQANRLFNVSLLYDKGPLHGRIAWNHTGVLWDTRFSNFTNANEFYRNRFQPTINTIDLQVRYDVSDAFSITLEAQNITDEGLGQNIGRDQEFRLATIDYAPAVLIGASIKF
jgi:TonB-dependent receptor